MGFGGKGKMCKNKGCISENIQKVRETVAPSIKQQLIVSLTSYPARIDTVHLTIQTLLRQTVKADKVILYLSYEQFPQREKDLPRQLTALTQKGLSISWCHDLRSYKKLIPALRQYPEAVIVTADDDILYAPNWLEMLWVSYEKNPLAIHCHRAHEVTFESRRLASYMKWNWEIGTNEAGFNTFATSGGGALYPPHSLYKDICDEQKFMSLAPTADDVWFWAMAVMNGTKIKVVENNQSELDYIPDTQDSDACLYKSNTGSDCQNDVFIKNVLKAYPVVLRKLKHIQVKPSFSRTKYYLFAIIPFLEFREKAQRRTGLLFGLPLFKQKKNAETTICYVCGIPVLKIRRG